MLLIRFPYPRSQKEEAENFSMSAETLHKEYHEED